MFSFGENAPAHAVDFAAMSIATAVAGFVVAQLPQLLFLCRDLAERLWKSAWSRSEKSVLITTRSLFGSRVEGDTGQLHNDNAFLQDAILFRVNRDGIQTRVNRLVRSRLNEYGYRTWSDQDSKVVRNTYKITGANIRIHPGISLTIAEEWETVSKGSMFVVTFRLTSALPRARDRIDEYVSAAMEMLSEHEKRQTAKRVFIYPRIAPPGLMDGCGGGGDGVAYKSLPLDDSRDMSSVFFDEKDRLVRTLTAFRDRGGAFGKTGVPYRLGVLLHGPPGTGKTSLIKAIANFTERSILTVPISLVRDDQMFADIMLARAFAFADADGDRRSAVEYGYEKFIVVLEDVDAMTSATHKRDFWAAGGGRKEPEPERGSEDPEGSGSGSGSEAKLRKRAAAARRKKTEKPTSGVTLAGILNGLDGIVETTGRILIMTTNHPDRLDPALVRPGRVGLSVKMAHLTRRVAEDMLRYHFDGAGDDEVRAAAEEVVAHKPVIPARLEMACQTAESPSDAAKTCLASAEFE